MTRLLVHRLLAGLLTLFLLLTLSFFLVRAAPGGPLDRERSLPPAVEAAMAAQFDLDAPLHLQYLRYLGRVLRGDLGPSFQYDGYRVTQLIAQALPLSLLLGAAALILALAGGIAIGVHAALRRGGAADRLWTAATLTAVSLPSFVVAPLLILLLAVELDLLPAGGWDRSASALVLPVVTLALPQLAYIARLTRSGMIEALDAPWLRSARARGLGRWRLLRHALPGAVLPVLSFLGPAAAGLLTGSVVIEQIFGLPGVGRHFVQAALNRDYTLLLGVVLLYGALIVLFNALVDLLYAAVDPRVRRA